LDGALIPGACGALTANPGKLAVLIDTDSCRRFPGISWYIGRRIRSASKENTFEDAVAGQWLGRGGQSDPSVFLDCDRAPQTRAEVAVDPQVRTGMKLAVAHWIRRNKQSARDGVDVVTWVMDL
jgi:hypothetical protein